MVNKKVIKDLDELIGIGKTSTLELDKCPESLLNTQYVEKRDIREKMGLGTCTICGGNFDLLEENNKNSLFSVPFQTRRYYSILAFLM